MIKRKVGTTITVTLSIDARHWPWLVRHARRLRYFGPLDYLHGIVDMALLREMDWNGEKFAKVTAKGETIAGAPDLDDGIPF